MKDNLDSVIRETSKELISDFKKDIKNKIEKFFQEYKNDLSKLNILKDKKLIKQINLPVELSIIEHGENNLVIQLYCIRPQDYLLLEIANSGVAILREEFKKFLNDNYKTKFTKKEELYVEPTYRVDIFYKKVLEMIRNS